MAQFPTRMALPNASATSRQNPAYSGEVRNRSSRGYGASMAICVKTRPGRGVITTMRCDR